MVNEIKIMEERFCIICTFFIGFLFTNAHPSSEIIGQKLEAPNFFTPSVRPEVEGRLGHSALLRCLATGNPLPKVLWYRHSFDGFIETLRSHPDFRIDEKQMSLKIRRLEINDEGSFSCIVWNQVGTIFRNFTVMIGDLFQTVETLKKARLINDEQMNRLVFKRRWLLTTLENQRKLLKGQENATNDSSVVPSAMTENVTEFPDFENKSALILGNRSVLFALLAGCGAFTIGFILMAIVIIVDYRRTKRKIRLPARSNNYTIDPSVSVKPKRSESVKRLQFNFRIESSYDLSTYLESVVGDDGGMEIDRKRLVQTSTPLGEGEFGPVCRAVLLESVDDTSNFENVAVKTLKRDATNREFVALLSELKILKLIGRHTNIITLIGCCTKENPPCIVYEYCGNGNLLNFLRFQRQYAQENCVDGRTLTVYNLVDFCCQIARGMKYLASKNCVHRDLAARNIFLTDDKVIKISGFGLARDVEGIGYYNGKSENFLPLRWLAPESIKQKLFTSESDVWSYGIVTWEIMTLGGKPYATIPVDDFLQCLSDGYRLIKPHLCPEDIYCLMLNCWNFDPKLRWTFKFIEQCLNEILSTPSTVEDSVQVVQLETINERSSEMECDADFQ